MFRRTHSVFIFLWFFNPGAALGKTAYQAVCAEDIRRYCLGKPRYNDEICLFQNLAFTTSACRAALEERAKISCVETQAKYCPNTWVEKGLEECINDHVNEVNPACRLWLDKMLGREFNRGPGRKLGPFAGDPGPEGLADHMKDAARREREQMEKEEKNEKKAAVDPATTPPPVKALPKIGAPRNSVSEKW